MKDVSSEAVIEDVQLYDYALSPEELTELHTEKSPLEGGQGGVLPGGAGILPASNDGPVLLGDGPLVTAIIKYYYLNGQRVAQQWDGVFTWMHADHLSSATRITDAAGLEIRRLSYAAFGEEAENQGSGDEPKYTYTGPSTSLRTGRRTAAVVLLRRPLRRPRPLALHQRGYRV